MSVISKAKNKIKEIVNGKQNDKLVCKVEDNKLKFGDEMTANDKTLAVFKYLQEEGSLDGEFFNNNIRSHELQEALTDYLGQYGKTVASITGKGAIYFPGEYGKAMLTVQKNPSKQPEIKQYVHLVTRGKEEGVGENFIYSSHAIVNDYSIEEKGIEQSDTTSYTRSIKAVQFNNRENDIYVSDVTAKPTGDIDKTTIEKDGENEKLVISSPAFMVTNNYSVRDKQGKEIIAKSDEQKMYARTILEPVTLDQASVKLIKDTHDNNFAHISSRGNHNLESLERE